MTTPREGPARRTPRAEVRRRLLDAAARVFAERGYADSQLEEIAYTAGFTKGAVYSNFGSKQELFGAVLREHSETEAHTLKTRIGGSDDTATAMAEVAREVARRITEDTDRGRLGLEFAARALQDEATGEVVTRMRRDQRDRAARLIRDLSEDLGIRLNTAPGTAALLLHTLSNGLSMEHLADPETVDRRAVEQALTVLLTQLATTVPEEDT